MILRGENPKLIFGREKDDFPRENQININLAVPSKNGFARENGDFARENGAFAREMVLLSGKW